jgi:quinoprotein glucose dehydrogenase
MFSTASPVSQVWPIEEKAGAAIDVPGEKTAATQPHPPEALRYMRNLLKVPDDLIDFTPQLRAQALEAVKKYRSRGFARSRLEASPRRKGCSARSWRARRPTGRAAVTIPSSRSSIRRREMFLRCVRCVRRRLSSPTSAMLPGVEETPFSEVLGPGDCCAADAPLTAQRAREAKANAPLPQGGGGGLNVQGLPIVKPPYGLISAIDLNAGRVKWQTPHGDTPDNVRNNPALRGVNVPKTGQPGSQAWDCSSPRRW